MEAFKYTKLAAESGKDGLIALGIMALIAAFILFKLSAKPEGLFSKSNMLILICMGVFAVIAVNSVMSRLQSSGAWQITIDQQQLEWLGPAGIDKSFSVSLTDIKSFQITSTDNDSYASHVIVLNGGDEMELTDDSGLDFDEFAKALELRGVSVEQVEGRPTE